MEKTLNDQLVLVEREFKNSNWKKQLKFIEVLNSNEVEHESVLELEEQLELFVEAIVSINEYYLKTNLKTVSKLVNESLTENILIKGIIHNLQDRWWIREYSNLLNEYNKDEITFLLNEIIGEVYIKRVHRSSKIISKRMEEKFRKNYNHKNFLKCIRLIEDLIERFLERKLTYNSFFNYLNRETLFSSEIVSEIISKFALYQTELERVYVFYKLNRNTDDK